MTSIEWLYEKLKKSDRRMWEDLLEKAEEMHKQEIITAFDEGQEYEYQYHINNAPKFDSETYYRETFSGEGRSETVTNCHDLEISDEETFVSNGSDEHIVDTNEMIELPQQYVDKLGNEDVLKLGYCEISDEEIDKAWADYKRESLEKFMKNTMVAKYGFTNKDGFAKWYREQLKQRK